MPRPIVERANHHQGKPGTPDKKRRSDVVFAARAVSYASLGNEYRCPVSLVEACGQASQGALVPDRALNAKRLGTSMLFLAQNLLYRLARRYRPWGHDLKRLYRVNWHGLRRGGSETSYGMMSYKAQDRPELHD